MVSVRRFDPSTLSTAGEDAEAIAGRAVDDPGDSTKFEWKPFPVHALPEPLRSVAVEGADAMNCDASYIALPMLAAMGGVLGASVAVRVRGEWIEYPIVWSVVIARSGTCKTPAQERALRPLHAIQSRLNREYHLRSLEYSRAIVEWERSRGGASGRPAKPAPRKILTSDVTIESLCAILNDNPRGVLVAQDELESWLVGFTRYKSAGASDLPHWLGMHSGKRLQIDRKTSESVYVDRACVSVTGTIQPGIFARAIGQRERASGLLARLLLSMPPVRPRKWSDRECSEETYARYHRLVESLVESLDGDRATEGVVLEWTPDAAGRYREWWESRGHAADDDVAAARSKLDAYAARFALIFHATKRADAGDSIRESAVGVDDVEAGIELAEWFGREAERIYASIAQAADDDATRDLVGIIRDRGGEITARDLSRISRRYRSPGTAEGALVTLAMQGYGELRTHHPPNGGRPSCLFRLSPRALSTVDDRRSRLPHREASTIASTIAPSTSRISREIDQCHRSSTVDTRSAAPDAGDDDDAERVPLELLEATAREREIDWIAERESDAEHAELDWDASRVASLD